MSGCGCQGWTRNQVIYENQEQQESQQQQVQVPPQVQEDVRPQHSQLHLRHVRYYNTKIITPTHTPYILLQGVWLLHREWTDNKYFNRAHSIHTPVHTYCWRYRKRMYLDMLRNCLNVAPNINCTKCHAQRGWIKFIWKVVWRLPPTVHVLKKKKRWIYLYNIISKYGMYFPSHIHPHCTCSPIKNTCDFGSRSIE